MTEIILNTSRIVSLESVHICKIIFIPKFVDSSTIIIRYSFHNIRKRTKTNRFCVFKTGAGLSSVVISFLMSTYHNVIIAYAIYYFFAAFKAKQPWSECGNSWNTLACWLPSYSAIDNRTRPNASRTPAEEFFE